MDINYILRREQVSLYNASVSASGPAKLAHEGMAFAYGRLLAEAGFPHRDSTISYVEPVMADEGDRWMDDGGPDAGSKPSLAAVHSANVNHVLSLPVEHAVSITKENL
jgi:hypothetical protein